MNVRHFSYNGLFGFQQPGYADYTAEFKEWTDDPGVAVCTCSDGKERLIPAFALEGFNVNQYPEQNTENKEWYIGKPCSSRS